MEAPLTLIYTANLRGELAILPRLHNFIKRLLPVGGRAFLLDLGAACDPSAWHCQVSGGRSVPIALDGMGFHAANVSDYFAPDSREKIGSMVNIALIDAAHPHQLMEGVWVVAAPPAKAQPNMLTIVLHPAAATVRHNAVLQLADVDSRAGHVGIVTLDVEGGVSARVDTMPASMLPDPTIAGIVEFIISEADYARKRQMRD